MKRRLFAVILSSLFCLHLMAGKIEKGFQSLDIYNYFEAKRLFEQAMKKDGVAASYGLSVIYGRNDNPFFNLDSARSYILYATTNYSSLSLKEKVKYANIRVDSLRIFEQRDFVAKELYERCKLNHNVASYQQFLDRNGYSKWVDSVIYFRDHLAFEEAELKNTAAAFQSFRTKYPQSVLADEALSAYERLNYQERTASNNFIDYVSFVNKYPESPYRFDAEDEIYRIYTKTGSLESYKNFIATYPNNRNVAAAWKKMFNTYLQNDYSTGSMQSFLDQFPDYPFKAELLVQLERADQLLYPIKVRNKWGYTDDSGTVYIRPKYDIAEQFHEGLAIVSLEGKYGFIDKRGDIAVEIIFDDAFKMNEGHAVVQIDDKWGLINRSGEFVIQPEYEDLGNLTEGLCYFSKGEEYGYFDQKGIVRLKAQYTTAGNFVNGKAIVSSKGNYGLIDVFGTTTIPFKYEKLKEYTGNTYLAKFDGKWGLIAENGDSIVGFKYDFIGEMSDGRAVVELDDAFNYMDKKGNLILNEWIETYPEYKQLAAFTDGYAKIEFDNGYNFVDTLGKKLFSTEKEDVGTYGSLIAVKKNEKWGYVNKNGNLVIAYNFTSAHSFKGNLAKAGGAPLVGVINKKGNYQVEPYFERIEFFNDTTLITKSRGNYGLLSAEGDTLLPFMYTKIEPFTSEVVQLQTAEAVFYYNLKRHSFIRKEE